MSRFQLQKKTIIDLQLSNYYEDDVNCTKPHKKMIRIVASLFLTRFSDLPPKDIFFDSAKLISLLREDLYPRIEKLESLVSKLAEMSQIQTVANV